MIGRRALLRAAAVVPAAALSGCVLPPTGGPGAGGATMVDPAVRLTARPGAVTPTAGSAGLRVLDLGPGTDVLLYVPEAATGPPAMTGPASAVTGSAATGSAVTGSAATGSAVTGSAATGSAVTGTAPVRLVLALHGAGESPNDALDRLRALADAHGLLVLAPASHGVTWDVLTSGWGTDVRRIDDALASVFAAHDVDPTRLAINGFSDGASYALSLGLANADLFTHVIAFSPGVLVPGARIGRPRVFISHGRDDQILPIDDSTRRIVAQLDAAHIPTEVRIFDGRHTVPPDVADAAVRWLLG